MILLYVSTPDEKQVDDIADFLLENKLVLDAFKQQGERSVRTQSGDVSRVSHFVIACRTRALLYDKIIKELEKSYGKNMPLVYSVPIVNTDWNQKVDLVDVSN